MKHIYKPLAIISIGTLVAIYFLISDKITISPPQPPVSKAQTILRFSPHPIITSSDSGKADITIDTNGNLVNLMQVKFSYNPNLVYDIHIKKSSQMSNAEELNNFVDEKKGTVTFILSIPKAKRGLQGKATLAEFSFKSRLRAGDRTNLSFTKETMVTDLTSPDSLLQKTEHTQIIRKDTQ